VEENQERTVLRPRLDGVEGDAVGLNVLVCQSAHLLEPIRLSLVTPLFQYR